MPSRKYPNDVPEFEIEQRKMEALESIADNLLEIKHLLTNSTGRDGTLVITMQEAIY